jgi:hypothetical protein
VDRVCASQDLTAGGTATLTSTIVDLSTGAGGAPFGRALTVDGGDATGTGLVTITGTNYLGDVLVEGITKNGSTVVAGKKAFATVTSVVVTGDSGAGFIVGDAVLLGLPIFIEDVDEWVTELQNGTTATAGAWVAGDSAAPIATTGDVRGTYSPNTAPNGGHHFVLYMALSDPAYTGQVDFAG